MAASGNRHLHHHHPAGPARDAQPKLPRRHLLGLQQCIAEHKGQQDTVPLSGVYEGHPDVLLWLLWLALLLDRFGGSLRSRVTKAA
jgi:hypothetical protein